MGTGGARDASVDAVIAATGAAGVVAFVERETRGRVVRLERLARWRLGWFLDVEVDGRVVPLYARGARGADFPSPFDLAHEARVHALLEDHGFPVPHVLGIVDVGDTQVLVMDRAPGVQGLLAEPEPAVRARLMLECVEHMARMHAIPLDELAARGFTVPSRGEDVVWSEAIARLERHALASSHPPDPVLEFLRRRLRRTMPRDRTRPAFVTWDAAQFLHHDGRLTALIDFELAHVGDPLMDLAPLRSRDTMEPFGDLSGAFAHYESITGTTVDMDVLRWFEISQLTATLMLQRPVLLDPHPDSDLMTHVVWFVESARYALDVLAECLGEALPAIDVPEVAAPRAAAAHAHLVRSLHHAARAPIDPADPLASVRRWRARSDYRVARHLARVDDVGAAVEADELADVSALVGRRVRDRAEADAALVALVVAEDPALDVALLHHFDRRMQRASALVGPPDARSAQHVPLQPLPR